MNHGELSWLPFFFFTLGDLQSHTLHVGKFSFLALLWLMHLRIRKKCITIKHNHKQVYSDQHLFCVPASLQKVENNKKNSLENMNEKCSEHVWVSSRTCKRLSRKKLTSIGVFQRYVFGGSGLGWSIETCWRWQILRKVKSRLGETEAGISQFKLNFIQNIFEKLSFY